jgi:hypothetical protein
MPDGALDPSFSPPQLSDDWLPNPLTGTLASVLFPWHNHMIFTGRFLSVNGEQRSGIAMIDSTGVLLPPFNGCGVAPWTYQSFTHVSIEDIETAGPDTLYICGAYVGFDDCTTNDTLQRFVSRLLVTDLSTAVPEHQQATTRLYPNPASSSTTLEVAALPNGAHVLLSDALGRELQRQQVLYHTTTLPLKHLSDGIYTIEVLSAGQRLAIQRLVVQH